MVTVRAKLPSRRKTGAAVLVAAVAISVTSFYFLDVNPFDSLADSGPILPADGIAEYVIGLIVNIAAGNPFVLMIVGAAAIFFFTDPLSKRGGFLESASFAIKISTVAILAYLAVTEVGPLLSGGPL